MPVRLLAGALLAVLLPATAGAADAPPLVAAAERGDLATIRMLLERGADVDAARADGLTALTAAVYADHLGAADALLRAGAKAATADRYGITPLYLAARDPHLAVLCEQVRGSPVVTPDETGWRVGAMSHWLWVFATPDTIVYAIRPGRAFDDAATSPAM